MTMRKMPSLLAIVFSFFVQHAGAAPIYYVGFEDSWWTTAPSAEDECINQQNEDTCLWLHDPWKDGKDYRLPFEEDVHPAMISHAWISTSKSNEGVKWHAPALVDTQLSC